MVSRLPLGICRTRLMVLGTAVTIRDPRSTLLVSQVGCAASPGRRDDAVNQLARAVIGAKWAMCAVDVHTRYPEAIVNELTFAATV